MISATHTTQHAYDLVKTDAPRDAYAELDHFSLRSQSEEPVSAFPHSAVNEPDVIRYNSLFDLKQQWKRFDCRETACRLIVVLLLQAGFREHLPGLVRRKHPGQKLLISTSTGYWPGLVSLGDMALHSVSLGWQFIGFHRNPSDAISDAIQSKRFAEQCVLFYPEEMNLFGVGSHSEAALDWESRWM